MSEACDKISPRPSLPNPAKRGTPFGKACLPLGRGGEEGFYDQRRYYYATFNNAA